MLVGFNRVHHVTPLLQVLNWLQVVFSAQFKVFVITCFDATDLVTEMKATPMGHLPSASVPAKT